MHDLVAHEASTVLPKKKPRTRWLVGALFGALLSHAVSGFAVDDPAQVGQWQGPYPWPIVALHANLLPSGKVLAWSKGGADLTYLWGPTSNVFTHVTPRVDLYGSAHAFLPDGRLMVSGGIRTHQNSTDFFDFHTNTWTPGPDLDSPRAEPSQVPLANGEQVVLGGNNANGSNKVPQVFQTNGEWRYLTSALKVIPFYPWTYSSPNGKVFLAGPKPSTYYLDLAGTGAWSFFRNTQSGIDRDTGVAVKYGPGKILLLGGGNPATATAEVINLRLANPQWRSISPMAYPRDDANAVLLPDNSVLVIGGSQAYSGGDLATYLAQAVLPAEMWNPDTNQWTTLASLHVPRLYHSVALLLPSGRVLVAGGGIEEGMPDHYDAEIYSPPYLFKGPRPTISSAPTSVSYGHSFAVGTPDAARIARVSWIRLGSVSHGRDMNQSINPVLSFARGSSVLTVSFPSDPNLCPPGHYMLFILDDTGVPSVAKIIQVGA